jgi:hypothetical protein
MNRLRRVKGSINAFWKVALLGDYQTLSGVVRLLAFGSDSVFCLKVHFRMTVTG